MKTFCVGTLNFSIHNPIYFIEDIDSLNFYLLRIKMKLICMQIKLIDGMNSKMITIINNSIYTRKSLIRTFHIILHPLEDQNFIKMNYYKMLTCCSFKTNYNNLSK